LSTYIPHSSGWSNPVWYFSATTSSRYSSWSRAAAAASSVGQHVAGPAVFGGGSGVPIPLGGVIELVEQDGDVAPGQLANSLLDDYLLRPGVGHLAHGVDVAAGQTAHLGERGTQVRGEPVDHPGAPSLGLLALQHGVAERV
jgi:hypothetical protein